MLISDASPPSASAPRTLELAPRLRLAVTRLARRLRQQTAHGLTPSQSSALASIERYGALSPSELADIERIQRPSATRVLGALAQAGLIAREADASDGRVARLTITKAGAATLKRERSRKNAYLARRLAALSAADRDTLDRAATILEDLLEQESPRSSGR